MVKENNLEFLISATNAYSIIQKLLELEIKPRTIMLDQIIRRTLYKVPESQLDDPEKSRWIRIMDGDIECDGQPKCSITYKDKMKNMTKEEKAVLKVDNYDDALHLLDLLHYSKSSYQENRRSKFICEFDQGKFIIIFDVWPKIEDVVFVSVTSASTTKDNSLNEFTEYLELNQFNICQEQNRVDVDSEYVKRIGYPAIQIPMVTFEFDFQLPQ